MTTEEFSNGFDVLVNSYSSSLPFGYEDTRTMTFDEYEKSVFLTKALEEIVVNLYNGKNIYGDSFENTEEIRRYLSSLVKTEAYDLNEKMCSPYGGNSRLRLSDNSVFFILPCDLAFITLELVTYSDETLGCYNGKRVNVYPVTLDEYNKIKDNPFRGPTKYKVLRVDYGDNQVELVSKYKIGKYLIKYLSIPTPIILIDLPDDLSIDNRNKKTECSLNPLLHRIILERAVALGVQSKQLGSINTTTTTTSTTNKN